MTKRSAADDGGRKVVEVSARTVDEAVARGLVRLGGLSRSEVKIEVLGEGRAGLLGFGAEEALVRLTVPRKGERLEDIPASAGMPEPAAAPAVEAQPAPEPEPHAPRRAPEPQRRPEPTPKGTPAPAPADAEDPTAVALAVTRDMLDLLGFESATLETSESLLQEDAPDENSLVVNIRGNGVRRLLESESGPLNAMQFLARIVVSRRAGQWVNLLLDVEDDRRRRIKELYQLAEQTAELVERESRPVSMPPMTAYERRVVHLALRDHPLIATQSIGSGDTRKVTVRRKDQLLPEL